MGNRGGAIHNEQREIVRPYKSRRWIACVLEFKGRHRAVMTPGLYTELFFLDEAVALAAGHRPCAECRRARFTAFTEAWKQRRKPYVETPVRADEMDAELHAARIHRAGGKITYEAPMKSLPNGSFVEVDGAPYLVLGDAVYLWTPERYAKRDRRPDGLMVTVLTPRPIIECFRMGYEPAIHGSVSA